MIGLWMLACSGGAGRLDADRDGFFADVDCDDADADVFPGSLEFCDGRDNDCDGLIDDDPVDARPWFTDADGDGYGDVQQALACDAVPGAVRDAGDCDDTAASVHPGAEERCDGVDEDCNGAIDDAPGVLWLIDADEDGFGAADTVVDQCERPPNGVDAAVFDCDDADPAVFPGAQETCDGRDQDCDGEVDEEVTEPRWYPDADGDGAGVDLGSIVGCMPPNAGTWATVDGDCDDLDPTVAPGLLEVCDGIDQDCDGLVDGAGTPFSTGPSLPIELTGVGTGGLALESVDLTSIGSPSSIRIAWGDCTNGFLEVPARFVDRWSAVGRPGPDGDGIGVLAVVLDDLVGPTSARLYADGGATGDVVVVGNTVDNGLVDVSFDSNLGGRISDADGIVFEQSLYAPLLTLPAGSLPLTATLQTVDAHPALTIVTNTATAVGLGGDVDVTTEWFVFSGHSEAWVSTTVTSNAAFVLSGTPTWADGVASFAGDVVGDPVRAGLFVDYPRLQVGLYDVEPAGPMRFALDHLRIAGVTGSSPTLTVPSGVEVTSSRVILSTETVEGLEVTTDRLRPTARALLGAVP